MHGFRKSASNILFAFMWIGGKMLFAKQAFKGRHRTIDKA